MTATNEFGCSTTCDITICVRDIQVYKKNGQVKPNKVYICHVPNGNNANPQTLQVSTSAVSSHLGNHAGDALGSCNSSCNNLSAANKSGELVSSQIDGMDIDIILFPNPSNAAFNVTVESELDDLVNVEVYDLSGQLVELTANQRAHQQITVGNNLSAGVYMIVVTQGDFREVLKATKSN